MRSSEKNEAEIGEVSMEQNGTVVRRQKEGLLTRLSKKARAIAGTLLLLSPLAFAQGCSSDSLELKKAKQTVAQKEDELRILEQTEKVKKLDSRIGKYKKSTSAHVRPSLTPEEHEKLVQETKARREEMRNKATEARIEMSPAPEIKSAPQAEFRHMSAGARIAHFREAENIRKSEFERRKFEIKAGIQESITSTEQVDHDNVAKMAKENAEKLLEQIKNKRESKELSEARKKMPAIEKKIDDLVAQGVELLEAGQVPEAKAEIYQEIIKLKEYGESIKKAKLENLSLEEIKKIKNPIEKFSIIKTLSGDKSNQAEKS